MEERVGTSFYGGGGGGITAHDVDKKIDNNNKQHVEERVQEHVIASKTQPTNQQAGDIWLVITTD